LPYLWIDATYLKVRQGGRIVSVAVTIAVGVNMDGRREVLGMTIGASEAEPFWTEVLRDLVRRGLSGVKLVISDAHEGNKAATARVLSTSWQRCRVHFQRNALAHAGKSSRRVVSAFIATAVAQPDHAAAKVQWRLVADQMRPKLPKLATLMASTEEDVLACMTFPGPTPFEAARHEPHRAPERRDQALHRRRRHLPQQGRHPPPGGGDPHGADRGMDRPARAPPDAGNARPSLRCCHRQPACRAGRLTSSALLRPSGRTQAAPPHGTRPFP
jgi:hypothetical protein